MNDLAAERRRQREHTAVDLRAGPSGRDGGDMARAAPDPRKGRVTGHHLWGDRPSRRSLGGAHEVRKCHGSMPLVSLSKPAGASVAAFPPPAGPSMSIRPETAK